MTREELLAELNKVDWYHTIPEEFKGDKEIVLKAVSLNADLVYMADDAFKDDEEIVLAAVKKKGTAFSWASDRLRANKAVVLEAVKNNAHAIGDASDELKNDRDVIEAAVMRDAIAFSYVSDEYKRGRDFILHLMQNLKVVDVFMYIHPDLQNDLTLVGLATRKNRELIKWAGHEVTLTCVRLDARWYKYMGERYRDDIEITKATLEQVQVQQLSAKKKAEILSLMSDRAIGGMVAANPADINLIPDVEKAAWLLATYPDAVAHASRDVIMQAARFGTVYLRDLSANQKSDKELDLAAVEYNETQFQEATAELKADREVVEAAVELSTHGLPLRYAHDDLKRDRAFVLRLVAMNGRALLNAHTDLCAEEAFVLDAVRIEGRVLAYASPTLKRNKTVIKAAVAQNGLALSCVQDIDGLFADTQEVIDLLTQIDPREPLSQRSAMGLRYINPRREDYAEIALAVIEFAAFAIQDVGASFVATHSDFHFRAISANGMVLEFADEAMRQNLDYVLAAVRQNGLALQFVSEAMLEENWSISLAAVKQNAKAIEFVPPSMRSDAGFMAEVERQISTAEAKARSRFILGGAAEAAARLAAAQDEAAVSTASGEGGGGAKVEVEKPVQRPVTAAQRLSQASARHSGLWNREKGQKAAAIALATIEAEDRLKFGSKLANSNWLPGKFCQ